MSVQIIEPTCSPERALDRSLPCNCYLVEYVLDGCVNFDLVLTDKKVEIFDYYWDHYRSDFINFKQTEGRVNPRLWNPPHKESKKK